MFLHNTNNNVLILVREKWVIQNLLVFVVTKEPCKNLVQILITVSFMIQIYLSLQNPLNILA